MATKTKVLVLHTDDFLREIIGNLLHKEGYYILNGRCVNKAQEFAEHNHIKHIILSDTCDGFKGKSTISYINTTFNNPDIFLLTKDTSVSYLPKKSQMNESDLSVKEILKYIKEQS